MTTKPKPSQIDQELSALAAAAGLDVSTFKVAGEVLYFVRQGETLLMDGRSLTRRELMELLKGETQL